MKRLSLLLALVLVVALSLGAGAQKIIEITYWTHTDDNRTLIENRYIAEFQKMYPNVRVKRVVNEAAKMGDLVLTAFSANNAPDLFNLPIEQEYGYMMQGRVSPVDYAAIGVKDANALRAEYMPGTFDSVTVGGKIYGLPLEITNWAIYINKKIFRSVGLDPEKDYPKTWEEMADISEKLTLRNGDIITRRGFDFRYPYYLVSLLPMVEQLGGALLSPDGKKAIVNDAAWLKVLKFMKEWGPYGRNLGSPTYPAPRKIWNKDNNDMAMCLSGFYQQGRLKIDNEAFFDSNEWMVVPFPVFKDAVNDVRCSYYGHFLMVNAQAPKEKQEMAWKLSAYMLSHPMEYLNIVNIIIPKKDMLDSKEFKSLPYMDVFMDDMAKSHMVFLHENGYQFERFIGDAVQAVMMSKVTEQEALNTLRQRIQEVLDEQ
jgi:multiple sugar transport system substrate-binding protein